MSITKKAIKFTKLIAYQLKDLYNENYDKEELKSSFQEAVRDLSKNEIKSEIQENIDKYVKKLQKYLNVQDGQPKRKTTFPCNLYVRGGHELADTEDLSEQEKQLLVSHVVSEHVDYKPDLMSRLDDFPTESDVFPELSSCHKLLRLTIGNRHGETLRQILFKYFNAVQPLAEQILTDQEIKRCGELAKEIKNFISVCHLRKKDCFETKEAKKKKIPVYEDILASLLSVYVELFVLSERLEDKKIKKSRQLCGFVVYVLPWQYQQLDLLLQLSAITEEDADIVIPLSRSILKWNSENKDEKYYLKYVLTVRALHDKVSDATDDIVQSTQTIPAPNSFMSWLLDQDSELCDEFPNDKGFKRTTVTKFLLEDAADDQVDRLLDIFTCNQSEGNQLILDQSTSEEQQNKTVLEKLSFFIDLGENNTKEENEGIFFIDKLGLGSKRKKNEDDGFLEETDTKGLKETENTVKLTCTKESDVMDTEVFVIDTESLVQQNSRRSPKKKRKSMQLDSVANKTMDDDVTVNQLEETDTVGVMDCNKEVNITPQSKQSERLIQQNDIGSSGNVKKKRKSIKVSVENLSEEDGQNIHLKPKEMCEEDSHNILQKEINTQKSDRNADLATKSENVETEIFVIDTENLIQQQNRDRIGSSKKKRKSKEVGDNVDILKETNSVKKKSSKSTEKEEHVKTTSDQINKMKSIDRLCEDKEKDPFNTEEVKKNLFKSVDVKCVEKTSIGKRTRQNSCSVDASEMTDDRSAVKKKRTTSQRSDVEENNDVVLNTQSTRRSRRVSECSLQHDDEENKSKNEIHENQVLHSGRSEQNDVSILRVGDQSKENSDKFVKYKIDGKEAKDITQTQKIPMRQIIHSEKLVESKTRKTKTRESKIRLNKGKSSFDKEMMPRSDTRLSFYARDAISKESEETSDVGTIMLTRSDRTYSNKSNIKLINTMTRTNQTQISVDEVLTDRQDREFPFKSNKDIYIESPVKVETRQRSRKNGRRCIELDFQREDNPIKPLNMLNKKIDQKINMENSLIKGWNIDPTDSDKESIYIESEVSDSEDENEDVSLVPLINRHLKESVYVDKEVSDSRDENEEVSLIPTIIRLLNIDGSVSKQRKTGDDEKRPSLPGLPSHPMNYDNSEANKIYKSDKCPKLFETKLNLNSSDTESDLYIKDTIQESPVKQKPKRRQSEPAHLKTTPFKEKPSVKTPGRKGMTLRTRKL